MSLMSKRKSHVIGEGIARPVAFVKNSPRPLIPATAAYVLFGYAVRPADWCLKGEHLDERRSACQPNAFGNRLLLKYLRGIGSRCMRRETFALVEKLPISQTVSSKNTLP